VWPSGLRRRSRPVSVMRKFEAVSMFVGSNPTTCKNTKEVINQKPFIIKLRRIWPSGLRRQIQDLLSMMRGFEPHCPHKELVPKTQKKESPKTFFMIFSYHEK